MKKLLLIDDETYGGGDGKAINRHRARTFEDQGENKGDRFRLIRCNDAIPPYFEAYGPYRKDTRGFLPRLKLGGKELWGDGWSWKRATAAFLELVGGEIVS